MATYKEQLHKMVENSSFPADRGEDIKHDFKSAFSDGSLIGEMVADVVSNTVGKAIDKFGIDKLVTMGADGIKDMVGEAVMNVLGSNELLTQMSESFAQKQAAREQNFTNNQGKEMGA